MFADRGPDPGEGRVASNPFFHDAEDQDAPLVVPANEVVDERPVRQTVVVRISVGVGRGPLGPKGLLLVEEEHFPPFEEESSRRVKK